MKRLTLSIALTSLGVMAGANAMAETNVTLYGIVDVSMRYLNTSAGNVGVNSSRISMENGAISNSRWGLRGSEDLGNGMSAFFRLENGFGAQNGIGSASNKTFSRLAYVGLNGGEIGKLTLGLQNTPMFDMLADYFDPLTVGNYDQNSWLPVAMSRGRNSNMFTYSNTLGDLAFAAAYANGDDYNDRKAGELYGTSLRYTMGAFAVGGAFQYGRDADNSDFSHRNWNLNASYQFDGAKVFAGYFNGRDETGFVNAVAGGVPVPGLRREDDGYFAGLTYQATQSWALTGAAYYDRSKNLVVDGDKGRRWAVIGVAEYSLSKRSQVYVTMDYNKVSDAAQGEIAGRSSQLGGGVGFRHIF